MNINTIICAPRGQYGFVAYIPLTDRIMPVRCKIKFKKGEPHELYIDPTEWRHFEEGGGLHCDLNRVAYRAARARAMIKFPSYWKFRTQWSAANPGADWRSSQAFMTDRNAHDDARMKHINGILPKVSSLLEKNFDRIIDAAKKNYVSEQKTP